MSSYLPSRRFEASLCRSEELYTHRPYLSASLASPLLRHELPRGHLISDVLVQAVEVNGVFAPELGALFLADSIERCIDGICQDGG